MNLTVFCDIDGVLADCSHRLHYALEDKNYDKYYSDEEVSKDVLIYAGYELIKVLANAGADVHYVTGRNVSCHTATLKWIRQNFLPTNGCLAMRNKHDYRPSPVVKVELIRETYEEIKKRKKNTLETQDYHSTYFIDDDPENVKAVCEAYPRIQGIVFGTKRMEE